MLQRTVGNAAVARTITRRSNALALQRCGEASCDCDTESGEKDATAPSTAVAPAVAQHADDARRADVPPPPPGPPVPRPGDRLPNDPAKVVLADIPIRSGAAPVQRQDEDAASAGGGAGVAPAQSYAKDVSSSATAEKVDQATARAMVDQGIAALSGMPGAVVRPFPDDLVASNEAGEGGSQVQASAAAGAPSLQRSGGGKWGKPEGGFIGSLQLCYDLCKKELSVLGWVWAGAGVTGPSLRGEAFYGAYVFAQKAFGPWPVNGPGLTCGTCRNESSKHGGDVEWGGGLTGFPAIVKPNQKAEVKGLGFEFGALLTPHPSTQDANLELIVLIDVTQFLGPVGAAVKRAEGWVNTWAPKLGVQVDCGVGLDFSADIHLCRSVPGGGLLGVTSDSAKLCGGGYVGCNINLPHDVGSLPH